MSTKIYLCKLKSGYGVDVCRAMIEISKFEIKRVDIATDVAVGWLRRMPGMSSLVGSHMREDTFSELPIMQRKICRMYKFLSFFVSIASLHLGISRWQPAPSIYIRQIVHDVGRTYVEFEFESIHDIHENE